MSAQRFCICMLETKDNWLENNMAFNKAVPLSSTFFPKDKDINLLELHNIMDI